MWEEVPALPNGTANCIGRLKRDTARSGQKPGRAMGLVSLSVGVFTSPGFDVDGQFGSIGIGVYARAREICLGGAFCAA